MRTGSDYLRSLNDGRQVFVEGERVKDVTAHLAFREAARSVARLYDIAATPSVLAAGGQNFADNVVAFYEHLRDNHLYASYAIVPPQIDRSKPAHKQSDPTL